MHKPALTLIAALAASGCAMTANSLQGASLTRVCWEYRRTGTAAAFAEIRRRGEFAERDLSEIQFQGAYIGMPAAAARCSWGDPSSVDETAVEGRTSQQWVYETYLGRTTGSIYRFLYIEDDRVAAIQR